MGCRGKRKKKAFAGGHRDRNRQMMAVLEVEETSFLEEGETCETGDNGEESAGLDHRRGTGEGLGSGGGFG